MIFRWKELIVFFAVLLVAAWALYPDYYTRGLMHRADGDRSLAIDFFKRHLRAHPNHKGASIELAAAYEAAGRPEEALPALLSFYRQRRGDLETGRAVLELLGRAAAAELAAFRWELVADLRALPRPPRRQLEELIYQAYQDAASRQDDEETMRALRALAQVSASAGFRDQMLRLLMERRQLDAAIAMLRGTVDAEPGSLEARRMLARVLRAAGDEQGAVAELDAGLKLVPSSLELLGDKAALFMSAKRWEEAEAALKELIRLEPDNAAWLKELARCLIESGRFDQGVKVHEQLLAKAPRDRALWWAVIYSYSDAKRHAAAANKLEAYLGRFDDGEARKVFIYELEQAGEEKRALEFLRRRVSAVPSDHDSRRTLLGMLLKEERFEEAAGHYRALLEADSTNTDLWEGLAYVEQTRGRLTEAAVIYERYLKLHPEDGRAVEKLAQLYLELGQRPRAIELLKRDMKRGAK